MPGGGRVPPPVAAEARRLGKGLRAVSLARLQEWEVSLFNSVYMVPASSRAGEENCYSEVVSDTLNQEADAFLDLVPPEYRSVQA